MDVNILLDWYSIQQTGGISEIKVYNDLFILAFLTKILFIDWSNPNNFIISDLILPSDLFGYQIIVSPFIVIFVIITYRKFKYKKNITHPR